jgi:hypothetical protein
MSQNIEKKTMILEFLGMDDWSRPVYKNQEGRFFKDINCDNSPLDLCTASGFDGEPDTPITYIERYKDVEVIITGRENEPSEEEKVNYMMLSRLKGDCDYFLGHGNRNAGRLWAGNVKEQIEKMKRLHDGFASDKKPDWLTYDDIMRYEASMTDSL